LIRPGSDIELSLAGELWATVVEELKARDFRGLVSADVEQSLETGLLHVTRWEAGWPWLHTHAWLSELENLGAVLSGTPPHHAEGSRYVVALPVTIPPWPVWPVQSQAIAATPVVEGLTKQELGKLFWHDVVVDAESQVLQGAGLDGLLGVARGSAHSFELARVQALDLANRIQVLGKQFRPDVGSSVPGVLGVLELQYGLRV